MQPDSRDRALLWDMRDAATAILEFAEGKTVHDYLNDRFFRNAIERNVEIIGIAAKSVSSELQAAHPEIEWHAIIAQRNVLAHEYGEIKHELLWNVVKHHLPKLIARLEALMES